MKKYISLIVFSILLTVVSCNPIQSIQKRISNNNDAKQVKMLEKNILEKKWKLVELYGKPIDKINGVEPYLILSRENKKYVYRANGGCNEIFGNFTLSGMRIKFSEGASNLMSCQDMSVEKELIDVLSLSDNYTINKEGNKLNLNKARMASLAVFRAVEK